MLCFVDTLSFHSLFFWFAPHHTARHDTTSSVSLISFLLFMFTILSPPRSLWFALACFWLYFFCFLLSARFSHVHYELSLALSLSLSASRSRTFSLLLFDDLSRSGLSLSPSLSLSVVSFSFSNTFRIFACLCGTKKKLQILIGRKNLPKSGEKRKNRRRFVTLQFFVVADVTKFLLLFVSAAK